MTRIASHPPRSGRGETGNVLLAVVIVTLALAGLALAFLETGVQESRTNTIAGERSRVGYIAETGVNEAVGDLLTGGKGTLGSPTSPIPFGGGEYWVRTLDHGDGSFTVTSVGRINRTVEAIEVVLAPQDVPLFSKALFGDLDLGAKGAVFTDSYDSELGPYEDQAGNTHPKTGDSYALPHGDLGSNRNIILRGGVTILGNATPGPGYSVQISGTTSYVDGSTAPAAATTWLPPVDFDPPEGATSAFVSNVDHTFTEGTYHFKHFQTESDAVIRFQGDVKLYIDGTFLTTAQSKLVVEPDSSVVIYHIGDSFSLTGGGMINDTQKPSSFRLLTRASKVKFSGNSTFYGVVYAPFGWIDPTGTTDIFGSFVARQIDINGAARFHYDEALSRDAPDKMRRLKRVSWRKVPATEFLKEKEVSEEPLTQ